jgi:hypothetical protein
VTKPCLNSADSDRNDPGDSQGPDNRKKKRDTIDDYTRRLRLRAYLIWECAGQPGRRDAEFRYPAEREAAQEEDAAGLRAGRAYDKGVKEFEESGRIERAAKAAQQALEGSERDELERAQETARHATKGDGAAGRRWTELAMVQEIYLVGSSLACARKCGNESSEWGGVNAGFNRF